MYKEQLLDYQAEKEYLLIHWLYIENFKLGKSDICKKLNITYPTLKKMVDRINSYFTRHLCSSNLHLVNDSREIYFECVPQMPIDQLTSFFFVESDCYRLLNILYNQKALTRTNLANKLNVSMTKLNFVIIQCNKLLQEFDLCIKNGRIQGNVFQYFYFYFLFYWGTETFPICDLSSLKSTRLIPFVEEKYQQKIGMIEQKKLSLWCSLLREKKKLLTQENIAKINNLSIANVQKTELFKSLKFFFHQEWKELSKDELTYVSYLTYLFFNSFEILDAKIIDLNSIHINDQRHLLLSKIILLLQDDYNIEGCYQLTHSMLYYLLGKMFFFKGTIYSIDQLTMAYSIENYISEIEKETVNKIINSGIFQGQQFNESLQLYYKYGLYSIAYSLKKYRKNKVHIALLLNTSSFLFSTFLTSLEETLHNNPAIQVTKYLSDKSYDLVITNLTIDKVTNTKQVHRITDMGNKDQLNKISSTVENILLSREFVIKD
ncbi:helix-turn-helix domain-containing protein [Enterococcus ratti]|uniref:helix-turn-helix domain-containing protein n=1 Tax=Enterococcus ratti TaxID=150033 RepID=UPI0035131A02